MEDRWCSHTVCIKLHGPSITASQVQRYWISGVRVVSYVVSVLVEMAFAQKRLNDEKKKVKKLKDMQIFSGIINITFTVNIPH